MYREPGEDDSVGIGLLAQRERNHIQETRLSHQPVHNSNTPTSNLRKAADLVREMNERSGVIAGPSGVKLPRI